MAHSCEGFSWPDSRGRKAHHTCGWCPLVVVLIKEPRSKLVSPPHLHPLDKMVSAALLTPSLIPEPASSGWDVQPLDSATAQSRPDPLIWSRYCWLPRLYRIIQSSKSLLTTPSFCPFCSRGPWCSENCFQPVTVPVFLGTDFCLPGGFFLDSPRPVTFLSALSFSCCYHGATKFSLCMCSHIHVGTCVCEGRVKEQAQIIAPQTLLTNFSFLVFLFICSETCFHCPGTCLAV